MPAPEKAPATKTAHGDPWKGQGCMGCSVSDSEITNLGWAERVPEEFEHF